MNRGEVWWVEAPDLGRRPACILTRNAAIPVLRALLVAPATRTIHGIPTEVLLGPEDGMPEECALSLDNVAVVPRSMLVERITALSPIRLEEVCRSLDIAAGCGP
ncbi:MAG TPA: type II toxin-antitoxin system PemK/MazF family toxin [Actinomycetota bacterium]